MPLSRVQPEHYETLLADKASSATSLLAPFNPPAPQIFRSAKTGFRLRAEFRIWHEGEDLNYVMYRRGEPKTPIAITAFPIADERIQRLMPVLHENVRNNDTLRRKLFQIEFLATLSGELLVTLVYHRKLDEQWEQEAQTLRTALEELGFPCSLIGRSRKQKVILGNEYVTEVLTIQQQDYRYRQYEQAFTQPNGTVNIAMIEWACESVRELEGDLLELYCGNGNFTLPLAQYFPRVLATELSKTSVRAARHNIEENAIENIAVVRLSAEEVSQAMAGERVFRRLAELSVPLVDHDLRTVFVDPPRAGLDTQTLAMVANFDNIVYVSCNPETLAENLQQLQHTHTIKHFALFDQFPYTDHMECGVQLTRK